MYLPLCFRNGAESKLLCLVSKKTKISFVSQSLRVSDLRIVNNSTAIRVCWNNSFLSWNTQTRTNNVDVNDLLWCRQPRNQRLFRKGKNINTVMDSVVIYHCRCSPHWSWSIYRVKFAHFFSWKLFDTGQSSRWITIFLIPLTKDLLMGHTMGMWEIIPIPIWKLDYF